MKSMTAHEINVALSKKHTQDFFITECKNGPTWYVRELLRMDAVAIKKSWTKPCVTIYEVKVDRQDFLRDSKWPQYLEYCHRYYFACPKDLITPEDIPDPRVGLVWVYKNGNIRTVKPVPMRPTEIPSWFFQYIVFSKIDSDRTPFYSEREEYIHDYIAHKRSARSLSSEFKRSMIQEVAQLQQRVDELKGLESTLEEYSKIKRVLQQHHLFFDMASGLDELLTNAEKFNKSIVSIRSFVELAKKVSEIEVE